jgi:hypothetical protein
MKCFACNRRVPNPHWADTMDDQTVAVGSECYKHIQAAGAEGWRPPSGGPRLYLLTPERIKYYLEVLGFPPIENWGGHDPRIANTL